MDVDIDKKSLKIPK